MHIYEHAIASEGNVWRTVRSNSLTTDDFHPNTFSNHNITGITLRGTSVSTDPMEITSECGTPNPAHKLKANQGSPPSFYWVLRRFVNKSASCGSDSPTTSVSFV